MLVEHSWLNKHEMAITYEKEWVVLADYKLKITKVWSTATDLCIYWFNMHYPIKVLGEILITMGAFVGNSFVRPATETLVDASTLRRDKNKSKAIEWLEEHANDKEYIEHWMWTGDYSLIPVWHSDKGDIAVTKMATGHIFNCLAMLHKQPQKKINKWKWIDIFNDELARRGIR